MIDNIKKDKVWRKGFIVEGYDSKEFRIDSSGALMKYEDYGRRDKEYGWEIDHIYPKSSLEKMNVPEDKIDDILNLQPLHWKNNNSKSYYYPRYTTVTTFGGVSNILKFIHIIINPNLQFKLKCLYGKYLPQHRLVKKRFNGRYK